MADALFYLLVGLGIAAVLLIVVGPIYLEVVRRRTLKRRVEEAFRGRRALSDKQFYDRFVKRLDVPVDLVAKIKRIFEEELGVDLSRLDPEDDFSRNMSFLFEHDSLVEVEIVLRVEEEFDISITDAEADQVRTFEQIVTLVHQKMTPRH